MRIVPLALIAIGAFGVLQHFGLIDPAWLHLFWPLLLIGIGVAMLARGPRWRADMQDRMHDRWERRIQRRFGPGWASLSEEERERFRAGMRQWSPHNGADGDSAAATPERGSSPPKSTGSAPAPGEQR